VGKIIVKNNVSKKRLEELMDNLSTATDVKWMKVGRSEFNCSERNVACQVKPTIIRYIIKEYNNLIESFSLKLYNIDLFPDIVISTLIDPNNNLFTKIWRKEVKDGKR